MIHDRCSLTQDLRCVTYIQTPVSISARMPAAVAVRGQKLPKVLSLDEEVEVRRTTMYADHPLPRHQTAEQLARPLPPSTAPFKPAPQGHIPPRLERPLTAQDEPTIQENIKIGWARVCAKAKSRRSYDRLWTSIGKRATQSVPASSSATASLADETDILPANVQWIIESFLGMLFVYHPPSPDLQDMQFMRTYGYFGPANQPPYSVAVGTANSWVPYPNARDSSSEVPVVGVAEDLEEPGGQLSQNIGTHQQLVRKEHCLLILAHR